jgi:glycosyltransferase involved in cell wall biosynthesis
MDKLLSVIVPIYNAEKWLGRCIDSILSQSYESFELILVNDGSKDSSGEICDHYAKRDSRVKVIHKSNGGVSMARNTGIDLANGEYIIFVDSDDAISEGYLASMAKGMATGADLCICGAKELIFADGNIIAERDFIIDLPSETTICNLYSSLDVGVEAAFLNTPWSKAYKTQIIKENKIKYDPDLSLGEDIYFNLAYAKKIRNHVVFDKSVYYLYHRENRESLTNRFFESKYEDSVKIYDEWRRTIVSLGVDSDTLERFEKLYLRVMFSNIVHVYSHTKSKTKRKEMIEKVANNEWVRKSKSCGDGNFLVKLTTFFLIKRVRFMVKLLFGLKYFKR